MNTPFAIFFQDRMDSAQDQKDKIKADYQTDIPAVNGWSEGQRMELVHSVCENIKRNAVWICESYKAWSELDDCIQEGTLRAWRLSGIFDPSQGIPFRGFAMGNIKNAMKNWILYNGRCVHIPTTSKEVFERVWGDQPDDEGESLLSKIPSEAPRAEFLSEDDLEAVNGQMKMMTENERNCIVAYSHGIPPKEIGSHVGLSYSQVRNSLFKAISKIKARFPEISGKNMKQDKWGLTTMKVGEVRTFPTKAGQTNLASAVRYFGKVLGWNITCKKKKSEEFSTVIRFQ